ncbi:MAG: ATP-binding protein [Candidatus Sumerlaeia bacterium]
MASENEMLQAPDHTFDTIVGQDLVKRFLLRSTEQERLPQALLFTGPDGVGKRSLMFALAKHLLTSHFEPGSEKAQRAMGKIERGTHPDILVIQPTTGSGQIRREQIEELHDRAHFAPLEAPYRIILIHPLEGMNQAAANTLLKILEEPPPALRLITASRQIHQVLDTIKSRCSVVLCPPVELGAISNWLMEKTGCLRKRAETAAQLSGGRPGLAWELLSGQDLKRRENMCRELQYFQKHGYSSIFRVGNALLKMSDGPDESMELLLMWFRDMLVANLTREADAEVSPPAELMINRDMLETLSEMASQFSITGITRAIETILDRQNQAYSPFVDSDLLMEVLLTDVGLALKAED